MNYCAFSNGMRMIIFDRDYIFNTYDKTNKCSIRCLTEYLSR